jgi:hypothetical protein
MVCRTNPEQSNEQKTQTQHTQEDVLQAVYAGLRLNATGAEIFPHRHHLKTTTQTASWCLGANPAYNISFTHQISTYTALQGLKPNPRCRGKQNCVSDQTYTHKIHQNILEKASDACTHECLSISFLQQKNFVLQTHWTLVFSSHAQGEHKTHHISLYLNSFSHIHMGTLIVQLRAIARS